MSTPTSHPHPEVQRRIAVERRIIKATVADLLAAGYLVQVSYERGYDLEHKPSLDLDEVMGYVQACDEEHLMVYDQNEISQEDDRAGSWVYLVYGNDGWDVVSDYTTDLEEALKGSLALADKLSE